MGACQVLERWMKHPSDGVVEQAPAALPYPAPAVPVEDRFEAEAMPHMILFHCVSHHRRRWFRFPLLKETEEFMEANLTYTAPIPEQLTDEEILGALDRIPAEFRAVVLLVDVEEFAYKEAAEIVGVPIGTVMSRLSRGRRLLREQLAEVARSYGISKAAQEGQGA